MDHSLVMAKGLVNSMKLCAMPCRATQGRQMSHSEELWQNMVYRRWKWQIAPTFLPWEHHERYEKATKQFYSNNKKKKRRRGDQNEGLSTLSHLETPARLQGMRHWDPGSALRRPDILEPRGARRLWCQEQVLPFGEHLLFTGQVLRLGELTALTRSQWVQCYPLSLQTQQLRQCSSPQVTPSGGTELGFEPNFLPQRTDVFYKQQDGKSLRQPLPCGQTNIGTLGWFQKLSWTESARVSTAGTLVLSGLPRWG